MHHDDIKTMPGVKTHGVFCLQQTPIFR